MEEWIEVNWADIDWDIRHEGRPWPHDEFMQRFLLAPEKIEAIKGKLLWCDNQRMLLLGLLLENLGLDKAIRLGDPALWRQAITKLEEQSGDL